MSVEYKEVVCANGLTWDSVAYSQYGDGQEFTFRHIMEANRQYSRTLAFDGGEHIAVPLGDNAPVLMATGDPSSQTVISIVSTPWTA